MIWSIILDGVLVILLGVTIGFAIVVNRKLDTLRLAASELEQLSGTLADSLVRTEDGLSRLKVAARSADEELQRSEKLAEDLRYLLERGDTLADRLEAAVKTARTNERIIATAADPAPPPRRRATTAASAARPAERPQERETDAVPPRSRAERHLLDMLRAAGLPGAPLAGTVGASR